MVYRLNVKFRTKLIQKKQVEQQAKRTKEKIVMRRTLFSSPFALTPPGLRSRKSIVPFRLYKVVQ